MRILRLVAPCALLLAVAGCETDADFWRPYHWAMAETGTRQQTPAAAANSHCAAVAGQRAEDARANRLTGDEVAAIYRGTYADCVAWDARAKH
jgi:hypothetical protein